TLARHREVYHLQLLKQGQQEVSGVHTIHHGLKMKEGEGELPTAIPWDAHPRFSLRDHLLPLETTFKAFSSGKYEELAGLATAPYQAETKHEKEATTVRLWHQGGGLEVKKRLLLQLGEEGLEINYKLVNQGQERLHARFGSEWNLNLLAGGGNKDAFYEAKGTKGLHPGSPAELPPTDRLLMGNRWLRLRMSLELSPQAHLWLYPVETLSLSEDGVERVYQGSCIFPWWEIDLAPGQSLSFSLQWQVE
ncbi:MAG: alpha-amylase/4-alpha-glucanotransferase domain-containing protein, partial [Chloroflexota bacterium]